VKEIDDALRRVETENITVVLGVFNAHVVNDPGVWRGVIYRHAGDADLNDNARFLLHLCSDMGRLRHKCNRLRLLATCSITITNKQNNNVIDFAYDYIKSNHDYNRDYICLETL